MTSGGATTTYAYDAAGRLTSAGGTTYGYDNDGNRTSQSSSSGNSTYTYDQADRLISATTPSASTTYAYNGNGDRASKTVMTQSSGSASPNVSRDPQGAAHVAATTTTTTSNTTPYVWDPLTDALISDGTNEYVSGAGGGLLVQTPVGSSGSAALFGIPDNLGSTRVLQSSAGATQSTYAYDAFGVPKAGTGTTQTSLGYTGQLTDTETGFQDLRARMYDPSTGQFLSADTYGGSTQDALSLNGYSYADNAPTTLTDPTGHCGFPLGCLHQAGVSLTELAGTAYVAGSYGIGWATGAGASYLEQVQANFQHGQSPFAALTNVNTNALLQSGRNSRRPRGKARIRVQSGWSRTATRC